MASNTGRYRRGSGGRGNVNHLVMVAAISSRRAFLRRASRSWPGGRLIALFLDWLASMARRSSRVVACFNPRRVMLNPR